MAYPKVFFEPESMLLGSKVIRECEPYEYTTRDGQKVPLRQYGLECPCGNVFKRQVAKLQVDVRYNREVRCPTCQRVKPKMLSVQPKPKVLELSQPRRKILNLKGRPTPQPVESSLTKGNYIEAIQFKLASKYPTMTKSQVRDFLSVEAHVLADQLRRGGEARIPNVVKFTLVNHPGSRARVTRNPATGKPMQVAAKPPYKKVKVRILTDFLISVGSVSSKRVIEAVKRREESEPVIKARAVKKMALSKLTLEEKRTLGLIPTSNSKPVG